jgi:hypothetical protein
VTEQEWWDCTDPLKMLEFLGDYWDRKRWLFTVACCRRIRHLIPHECARLKQNPEHYYNALEVAERYADSLETQGEDREQSLPGGCNAFALDAFALASELEKNAILWDRPLFVVSTWASAAVAPNTETVLIPWWVGSIETGPAGQAQLAEQAAHCHLLRDIFGNPFRPITLDPAWLSWHDGLLISMARQMYDSREFRDMPILADGLEEAGCSNQDILDHCRTGGEHVRGCWVVDLLLRKS